MTHTIQLRTLLVTAAALAVSGLSLAADHLDTPSVIADPRAARLPRRDRAHHGDLQRLLRGRRTRGVHAVGLVPAAGARGGPDASGVGDGALSDSVLDTTYFMVLFR